MKVLFLTRYPEIGASSRYRVYQYVPHLEKMGISCEVDSFMNDALYRATFQKGKLIQKLVHTIKASFQRLAWVAKIKDYDVVVFQRECLPFGGAWMERWISKRKPTIFDYDDALFIHKPSRFNKLATWLRRPDKYYDIFSSVDCVLAGNQWLADVASKYCKNSIAFHVAEDTERIPMRASQVQTDGENRVTLGWLGSKTTEKYLELIREPLEKLARKHEGLSLKIIGGGNFSSDVIHVDHVEWALDSEVEYLCSLDIGIMPLPMEEWSRGKSGGKARTYMAAGVPPVVTEIGYNIELIANEQIGKLVSTEDEWYAALDGLILSPDRRQQMGEAARDYVIEHFSLQGQAAKLAGILDHLHTEQAILD